MTFGQRLAKARTNKKLTQDQLGEGLGTDGKDAGKAVVLGWEKDRHFPKVDQLALICERLSVTADELVLGRKSEWPFSAELLEAVSSLKPEALQALENMMRGSLGLAFLATKQVADINSQEQSDSSVALTKKSPARLPPALADRLAPESSHEVEVDRHAEVPSARRHRSSKGAS